MNFTVKNVDIVSKGKYKLGAKRVRPKTGNKFQINDIRTLYKALLDDKGIDRHKISISVKTIDNRYLTIKSFKDNEIKDWDDVEYLKNKVKDDKKFLDFVYADFYVKT